MHEPRAGRGVLAFKLKLVGDDAGRAARESFAKLNCASSVAMRCSCLRDG
ncbi:MAG: hypothetical protein WKF84_00705 [Pyrinomonadaceae bacterium]